MISDSDRDVRTATVVLTRELCKTYRSDGATPVRACDRVSIDIAGGEVVALTGPSGSGKSTLLHLLGALQVADSGTIEVAGWPVTELSRRESPRYRRTVGFVFQSFHLLPTLTATDNVLVPLLSHHVGPDVRERARSLLASMGLAGREDAMPSKLSSGQQQRVAIARALINAPNVVLADEPTGNLDSKTGGEIMDLLFDVRDRLGTTMVIATHDAGLAERCDRVIHLRDGRVEPPAAS
jgi:putative ABC transport system ATP-binding protein